MARITPCCWLSAAGQGEKALNVAEVGGGTYPDIGARIESHFRKFWHLYLGAFVGLVILSNMGDGTAGKCVAREVTGQFETFYNACDEPIVAMLCGRYILSSKETCRTNRYLPRAHIHTHGSDRASILVAGLSESVTVFACKDKYRPKVLGATKYKCEK